MEEPPPDVDGVGLEEEPEDEDYEPMLDGVLPRRGAEHCALLAQIKK